MYKLAAVLLLLSTSAFAQNKSADPTALQNCPPIGQTSKGELIYSLDCKAITTDWEKRGPSLFKPAKSKA